MTIHTGFFVIVEDEDCGDTHGDSAGLRNPSFLFFLSFFRSESKANQRKQKIRMYVCVYRIFLSYIQLSESGKACLYVFCRSLCYETFRSQRLYRHMETSPSWNIECGIGQMSNDSGILCRYIHTQKKSKYRWQRHHHTRRQTQAIETYFSFDEVLSIYYHGLE